jgi:hypothetical protein
MVPRRLWRMLERGCDRCAILVRWLVPACAGLIKSGDIKLVGQNDKTSNLRLSIRLNHPNRIVIIRDWLD